jgi:primosomal protein N' (replication factor Y)
MNSDRELCAERTMAQRSIAVKAISSEAFTAHAFNPDHLEFFVWVAKYYAEPLSKVLDLAIPTPSFSRPVVAYQVTEAGIAYTQKLTERQKSVLTALQQATGPLSTSELLSKCGASPAVCSNLAKKGLIAKTALHRDPHQAWSLQENTLSTNALNEEQLAAVEAIVPAVQNSNFSTFLLQGVTGSGKTEVYLDVIIETLKKGLSALIIVPEIALTPQLTDRFSARLQQPIAVLHSSLKPSDRWQHWANLASGQVRVAIGARSGIFAPMSRLGVIVVDEEHDSSFKQGEGIRYHARDLALVRAKLSSCPVILGSATPSLESYHNALQGKYRHLKLTRQFHSAATSTFELVDLNLIKPWEMPSKNISPALLRGLARTLANGAQAFILYNRRGFASYLQCSSCEQVIGCPHCSVTLTYHRNSNTLLCHQCNFSMIPPLVCLGCGKAAGIEPDAEPLFAHRGAGTERVHEELSSLLPNARIAKLDRDSASTMADYIEILKQVREHTVDILVGTQMIAKGHDLPNVTFVGIVDCDVGLHMPDFRAAERGFQLLTQVAGRAGRRSTAGHVVLQTRVPKHPSLAMTVASNFSGFAEQELELRRTLGYPPFQKLLRIIVSAEDRSVGLSHATHLAHRAQSFAESMSLTVLGPAPAPIEKVRGLWRYHILVKAGSGALLQNIMQRLKREAAASKASRIAFDLDPHDML